MIASLPAGWLLHQEFRILDTCTKFNEACEEIVEACRSTDPVPDSLLSDMLEEVMDYCQTLQIFSQQRKSNVDAIIQMEKQNLEEFRRLHSSIECEHQTRTALAAVGVGAVGAVAMAASGPVALVAVALLGLAGGKSLQTHRSAANQVQQALMADMQMKNVPVQCLGQLYARDLCAGVYVTRIVLSSTIFELEPGSISFAEEFSSRHRQVKVRIRVVKSYNAPWRDHPGTRPQTGVPPSTMICHQHLA